MAGGEDGVKRGFSILDFGFLIVPGVQVIEVFGAKKQRYGYRFESDNRVCLVVPILIQYIV